MVKTDWVPKVLQRFADLRWMLCIYLLVLLTFVLLAGCGPAPTPTAAPTSTKALTPTAVPPTLQKNQVGDSVIWTTSDKRVAVAVPSQAPPVVELTFESLQITPPPIGYKIDGFTFKESVLNIQARDKEKQPMLQFTSSIRLYVTYKSEDLPDPTRLTFGCRSDKQVMMFTPTTQRFTLLKAETSADGKSQFQFYSWDSKIWKPTLKDDGSYLINDLGVKVPVKEIEFVYSNAIAASGRTKSSKTQSSSTQSVYIFTAQVESWGGSPTCVLEAWEGMPMPTATPPWVGPGYYEDNHSAVQYSGSWSTGSDSNASGGSWHYSNSSGAIASLTFNDTAVTWYTRTGSESGIAEVRIDSGTWQDVDLYSATLPLQWKVAKVFSVLGTGQHTIAIRVSGRKNSASSGYLVDVDAFLVGLSITPTPTPP